MAAVEVQGIAPTEAGWRCTVVVREPSGATCHEASIRREDVDRLTGGSVDVERLAQAQLSVSLARRSRGRSAPATGASVPPVP